MAGTDETIQELDRSGDENFSISMSFDDSVFAIKLFGELDIAGVPKLARAIARAEETSAVTILVDLSALRFIDSNGVAGLLAAGRHSREGSGRLHFRRGVGQVEQTITLLSLDRRLQFVD
jgi:anti-anti-sigma factor